MADRVPFVGPSYQLRRKKADVQRSINLFPTPIESGSGKSGVFLKSIPGLSSFSAAVVPPPDLCFYERFIGFPTGYGLVDGTFASFTAVSTPFVNTLQVLAQNVPVSPSIIERSIPEMTTGSISCRFRITSFGSDDAGVIQIYKPPVVQRFAFNPRREASVDALRRPYVYIDGTAYPMGSGSLSLNVQYQLDVLFGGGAGGTTKVTIKVYGGSVILTTEVPGLIADHVTKIQFQDDRGGLTCGTEYAEVVICP